MSMIKSYAAKEAGGELEVYEYDPGELKPQDVEVQVDYCGICHSGQPTLPTPSGRRVTRAAQCWWGSC